jgi:RNA polymerase sigma factor (sigma-70 family)
VDRGADSNAGAGDPESIARDNVESLTLGEARSCTDDELTPDGRTAFVSNFGLLEVNHYVGMPRTRHLRVVNDRQEGKIEQIEVFLDNAVMEIIEKAVNELLVSYRVVFTLRDVEGLSNEEVAKVLGPSTGAIKSRIHRARLFLRDRLSDYFYEWRK